MVLEIGFYLIGNRKDMALLVGENNTGPLPLKNKIDHAFTFDSLLKQYRPLPSINTKRTLVPLCQSAEKSSSHTLKF